MSSASLRASHPAATLARAPESAPRTDRRTGDRRRGGTRLFSRYTLFGGRRVGDRRDPRGYQGYVDLYEPWVGAMMVAVGLLCALDAVFTLLYLQKGGSEANPVMDALIRQGPVTFVLVKCAVTNAGLLVLVLHKNFRWVKQVLAGLFVMYAALFAYHLYLAATVS
ncbi:MAG: hypothetical protein HMLKMBBP_03332 [Planctomycetes bacterium]|nr:hypothetical protein [Planctomycetota bacterium]